MSIGANPINLLGRYNPVRRVTHLVSVCIEGRDHMKTLSIVSSGRSGCLVVFLNVFLAILLTVLSFRYVEPKHCYRPCGESLEGKTCRTGGCPVGAQKAGWPLPAIVDSPGGGSPAGGWGLIGPEDPPLFVPLLLDILFYSLTLWFVIGIFQYIWKRTLPLKSLLLSLPLNIFLTVSLWMFFWGSGSPIHRSDYAQVYVDTPAGRSANMAFLPGVFIPVGELVEKYGNPSDLWLTSDGLPEKPRTRIILHWGPIGMFVELPEVADNTYTVKETTAVEMILFPVEEAVIAVDGNSLGGKKIPWTGYGNYQR